MALLNNRVRPLRSLSATWRSQPHAPCFPPLGTPLVSLPPQGWCSSVSSREPHSSCSEHKVIFPNCHLYADNPQIYDSPESFSLSLGSDTQPRAAPLLTVSLSSWIFLPQLPCSYFQVLFSPCLFLSPVKATNSHLIGKLTETWVASLSPAPAKSYLCFKAVTLPHFSDLCDTHGPLHFSPSSCLISDPDHSNLSSVMSPGSSLAS